MGKDSLITGGGKDTMDYKKGKEFRTEWRKVRFYKNMSFLRFCIRMRHVNRFSRTDLKEWWRCAHYREL